MWPLPASASSVSKAQIMHDIRYKIQIIFMLFLTFGEVSITILHIHSFLQKI